MKGVAPRVAAPTLRAVSEASPPSLPVDPVAHIVPLIGEDAVRTLVAAFYRRVPRDPILGPMYPPQDLSGAQARLTSFLVQRFGGSKAYSRERGHPRLRMRHAPFRVDQAARDRWMELMRAAMDELGFDARVRAEVEVFLDGVATFLVNS